MWGSLFVFLQTPGRWPIIEFVMESVALRLYDLLISTVQYSSCKKTTEDQYWFYNPYSTKDVRLKHFPWCCYVSSYSKVLCKSFLYSEDAAWSMMTCIIAVGQRSDGLYSSCIRFACCYVSYSILCLLLLLPLHSTSVCLVLVQMWELGLKRLQRD